MQSRAQDKTCLIIFGMHRSGTSLLAKLCNLAGAALPHMVLDASESNEAGHWEPRRLAEYNDMFLAELARSWDDFRDIDLTAAQTRDYVNQLKFIIQDDFGDAKTIVLKEPRSSRFVAPTLQALNELGYRVCPVHALRHPIEVAQSLTARDRIPDRFSGLYWLRYVLDIERGLAGLDYKRVLYDDALDRPEATIRDIYRHFDLDLNEESLATQTEGFVKPSLRHHKAASWASAPAYYRDWVRPVYKALKSDGADADRRRLLEEASDRLSASAKALQDLKVGFQAALSETDVLQDKLAAAVSDVKTLERDIAKTLKESRDSEARDLASIRTLQDDLRDSRAIVKTLQSEFQAREAALEEKIDASIQSHQDELGALNAEIARLQTQVEINQDFETAMSIIEATFPHMLGESFDDARHVSRHVRIERAAKFSRKAAVEFEKIAENNRARGDRLHWVETQLAYATRRSDHFESLASTLYASTSWRITAPLRRVIQLWRNKSRVVFKLLAGQRLREFIRNPDMDEALDASRSPSIREARNALMARRPEVLEKQTFLLPLQAVPSDDLPSLTISAVTYNSSRWLETFFSSLLALNYPLHKVTLHVVDNGSTDTTRDRVQAFEAAYSGTFKSIILSERPNLGYGMGNDWAIRQSNDDYVLVTNVDVSFYRDSLRRCVEYALADQADVACWEFRQTPYEHPKYYDPVTLETNWNAHACVLFRRQAYLDVGGYDPKIFMYGEDVELSYRFRANGYRLRYVPSAVIEHYVDLDDATLRPHQLSGSTAANILLRYRYGTHGDIAAGEALLNAVKRNETDLDRLKAFEEVSRIVGRERWHFWRRGPSKRRIKQAGNVFPFNEFDYGITRTGSDTIRRPFEVDERDLPLISVITRTHGDNLQHVRNAVASVLNQTYPNVEHIIVEDRTDAARDYIEAIAERVGHHRLRYLKSPGKGRSECGNFGAQKAKGDWLCWLDNDDLLFADHIETLVRALDDNPNAVASYALAWDAHSTLVDGEPQLTRLELPHMHLQPFDKQRLLMENFIPIQAIIFRKSLFERFGGFNAEFDHLEDWNLWVRYAQVGDFVFTPKVTSLYLTPDDEKIRQRRHLQLHEAYETVRDRNLEDVAAIQRSLDDKRFEPAVKPQRRKRQTSAKVSS